MNGYRGWVGRNGTSRAIAVAVLYAATLVACGRAPADRRPSILLFVLDTTRVDAVSAYGEVRGTTPETDALAARGLRYTRAYAQAPWTLPSHATLFTGQLPNQHGVTWRRTRAADSLVTLAERLHDAGYETVGIAENPWLNQAFNLTQGFEHFTTLDELTERHKQLTSTDQVIKEDPRGVPETVAAWLSSRRGERPFFLFVNVIDPHAPYSVRPENPFLPSGVDRGEAESVSQSSDRYFCVDGREEELAILWGLYLGDVMAADAKLGVVKRLIQKEGLDRDLITVVTSDHGEHFGERRLVHHLSSVREALIRVPLVVHGARGVAPAVIDEPVQLADIVPTVLGWAGVAIPDDLSGAPLPLSPGEVRPPRPIVAEHDGVSGHAADEPPIGKLLRFLFFHAARKMRANCGPADKVFGDMHALVRYPHKVLWFSKYPAELYDLERDPKERLDLSRKHPRLTAKLVAELLQHVQERTGPSDGDDTGTATEDVPPHVVEQLRALGYVDTNDAQPGAVPPAP